MFGARKIALDVVLCVIKSEVGNRKHISSGLGCASCRFREFRAQQWLHWDSWRDLIGLSFTLFLSIM